MYCEGLAYKLTPIEYGGTGGTHTEKMLALLNKNYDLYLDNILGTYWWIAPVIGHIFVNEYLKYLHYTIQLLNLYWLIQ